MALYGVYDSCCSSLQLSPYENKIGGYPDFYPGNMLSSAPSCECCHAPQVLLVQLYCPLALEASPYHRLLHIFSCTESTCWKKSSSWLVLRSQFLDPPCEQQKKEPSVSHRYPTTAADWCEEADDWGSDADELPNLVTGGLDDKFSNLSVSPEFPKVPLTPAECVRQDDGKTSTTLQLQYEGPCYDSAYIRAMGATASQSHSTKAAQLLARYHSDHPDCPQAKGHVSGRSKGAKENARHAGMKSGGEKYEKSQAKHGDKVFLKFQKELENCPQQIIRYHWKGTAILMTDDKQLELLSPSPCEACGAPRVFECQLMPALVYILQTRLGRQSSCQQPVAVEFGTAIVYSCSASCWDETGSRTFNVRKEVLTVQGESK